MSAVAPAIPGSGASGADSFGPVSLQQDVIGPECYVKPVGAVGTQNATLTAAQLIDGIVEHTVITGAGTDTTDTGANLDAAIPNAAVGTTFKCLLVNTSASAYAITLAGGTGVTLKGSATTVGQAKAATLTFRRTAAATWTCYVEVSA